MYVRTSTRRNKSGQVVRYLQLAHNEWDADAGVSRNMNEFLLLMTLAGLLALCLMLALRADSRAAWSEQLTAYAVVFPRGVTPAQVASFLAGVSGIVAQRWQRPFVVRAVGWEVTATSAGVIHHLLVPQVQAPTSYGLGSQIGVLVGAIVAVTSMIVVAIWFYEKDEGQAAVAREKRDLAAYVDDTDAYTQRVERNRQDVEWQQAEKQRQAAIRQHRDAEYRKAAGLDTIAESIRRAAAALSDDRITTELQEIVRRVQTRAEWEAGEDGRQRQPAGEPVQGEMQGAAVEELHVVITTSMGVIRLRLFPEFAPRTVLNFVRLNGKRKYIDPRTGQESRVSYYDGTLFHRVVSGFMIQGGGRADNAPGHPGTRFGSEIHSYVQFARPYLLAVPDAGSIASRSQFFITVAASPHLNGGHTIFGEVADAASRQVVDSIAGVQITSDNRPVENVVIERMAIETFGSTDGLGSPRETGLSVARHVALLRRIAAATCQRVDINSRASLKEALKHRSADLHFCPFCAAKVKGSNLVQHVDRHHKGRLPR